MQKKRNCWLYMTSNHLIAKRLFCQACHEFSLDYEGNGELGTILVQRIKDQFIMSAYARNDECFGLLEVSCTTSTKSPLPSNFKTEFMAMSGKILLALKKRLHHAVSSGRSESSSNTLLLTTSFSVSRENASSV